ncbi:replication restart DNA helicase PriA [Jannaschia seohaensis]|uniref:Replication restart protein PriA n=2 Tax=Jannaschia seohaensis TaxID=475081 RepID=A0A2Y9A1K3_9RHOB|nr:primosomal protein N' [Jannaschia seohaensis]PWJ22042.1 replication restart DNA helicase PriA [Jannaschia seohaensis]SSA38320.1 replication restart DNA helicase PriA [Jannaschia seohaensis]
MAHYPAGAPVAVLTTQPLDRALDYRAPAGGVTEGDFVKVPLGPRTVLGVVWGPAEGDWPIEKLRPILTVLDVPPMRPEFRDFLERAGGYTLTPLVAMLRLALRAPGLGEPPGKRKVYALGTGEPDRRTEARDKVLDVLRDRPADVFGATELAEAAGVSAGVVKGLVASGAVLEQALARDADFPPLDPARPGKPLALDQADAAETLRAAIRAGGYGTTLLKGVTGSGKTEVYLEAVAECLARGRQALVLLPEIALTAEFLTRVEARFGARPAEWHSGVTQAERRRTWRKAAEGQARLVVGARSSLYLPFRDLGLIVVDEEHDTSYKQEDGVLYSARDMAVLRAACEGAQVVLASATPSLETWANAEQGKYARLDLTSRFGEARMPKLRAIDMRAEELPSGRWVSPTLQAAIEQRLIDGEQSLIFLNRRGYAPVTLCRACGQQVGCHQCDARMVEHRFQRRLMCHQCGETAPIPETCPSCGVEGKMAVAGPGVERMGEEVATLFPEARMAILSSDLFGSARALKARVEEIAAGGADIVVGTQLVAKGHNFPNLTLVGVIDADLGLQGSDLRAAERTFQLMRQVSGRAGRADKPGVALLQTYQPEHPVIRAILSGDEEGFWAEEAAQRRAAGVPPFGRMAGIVISDPDQRTAFALGEALARRAEVMEEVGAEVFGPAPAPIARIRGRHRVRLLVKAPRQSPIQAALARWVAQVEVPRSARLSIDIDPQSFL